MRRSMLATTLVCGALTVAVSSGFAAEEEELAKKLNNPIGDLVSVPFQFNWEFGRGRTTTRGTFSTSSRSFRSRFPRAPT